MKEHVSINEATKEELMAFPGISEETADNIIKYRDQHGPFKSIDDLANVKNMKQEYIEDLKFWLKV